MVYLHPSSHCVRHSCQRPGCLPDIGATRTDDDHAKHGADVVLCSEISFIFTLFDNLYLHVCSYLFNGACLI